jgi:SAM-dependent methyltransferase
VPDLAPDGFPLPPAPLIARAGATPGGDIVAEYLRGGAANKATLAAIAAGDDPDYWSASRNVLDFGCGAGNVMRHFGAEARRGEVWGCDVDADSIAWLQQNLCPPFHVATVSPRPSLPTPDDHFDLVYAISVFTHLVEDWAEWLVALHRTVKPDGVIVVTFLGAGMSEAEHAGAWDPDRVGMNVLRHGQDWDGGGPTVFHSDWWLRAHWGRAFQIVDIHQDRDEHGAAIPGSHGYVVMRKRPIDPAIVDLAALEPDEPREMGALQHNIEQLHADDHRLRELLVAATTRGDAEHAARVAAEAHADDLERRLHSVVSSRSWQLTKPLRGLRARRGPTAR